MAARKKTSMDSSRPVAGASQADATDEVKSELASDASEGIAETEREPVKRATAKSSDATSSKSKLVKANTVSASGTKVIATVASAAAAPAVQPAVASSAVGTAAVQRTPEPAAPSTVAAAAKAVKAPVPAKLERHQNSGEQKTMKTTTNRHGFKLNEFVVYPAHGVGQIVSVEEQEVAGFKLELFVINFVKDKMTLRVPTAKVTGVGMRKLSDLDTAKRSLDILTGRARIKRTMWSRRAQEYEAKINSGDINAIAEVVRDLYRSEAQPEQSYSERQLYEAALDRMMREIAVVHKVSETEALKLIDGQLKKNAKRVVKADSLEAEDADIEEAA